MHFIVCVVAAVQRAEAQYGCYVRGHGTASRLPDGDGDLLRRVFHRLPVFLHQHLRCLDHHHVPGAGRERTHGPGP